MMTTVRVNCDACGAVELNADNIRLTTNDGVVGSVSFTCPRCALPKMLVATPTAIRMLRALNVDEDRGPLTEAEITEFVIGLDAGDEWMSEILPG